MFYDDGRTLDHEAVRHWLDNRIVQPAQTNLSHASRTPHMSWMASEDPLHRQSWALFLEKFGEDPAAAEGHSY